MSMPDSKHHDLVADIGGTNARFARVGADGRHGEPVKLAVADYPDLAAATRAALERLPGPDIDRAAFAFAGPITGDAVSLTNAGWSFSIAALRKELGLAQLLVLNDFAALAWSLPYLEPEEMRRIGGGGAGDASAGTGGDDGGGGDAAWIAPTATLAVIGPGTGIGMSGLVPTPAGGWAAISGEGGHASLAPADKRETDILAWTRRHYPHVSIERLVSGSGLPLLHAAVGAVDGYVASDDGGAGGGDDGGAGCAQRDATSGTGPTAAEITDRALKGEPHAHATLSTFCAMLGGAAGNLALTLGARGGVYIGGGIPPRIEAFLGASQFRARFEDKGRFADYLAAIPTWLIDARAPALRGAAHALARSET